MQEHYLGLHGQSQWLSRKRLVGHTITLEYWSQSRPLWRQISAAWLAVYAWNFKWMWMGYQFLKVHPPSSGPFLESSIHGFNHHLEQYKQWLWLLLYSCIANASTATTTTIATTAWKLIVALLLKSAHWIFHFGQVFIILICCLNS